MKSSDPNFLQNVVQKYPHLTSPAALAIADTNGAWVPYKHLAVINVALMDAKVTPRARLAVNLPFRHGKTELCTIYFSAWSLLLWPDTRICLGSFSEEFSELQGSKVRDVIRRWGTPLGIKLRSDRKSKGDWTIDGHKGGMLCKGRKGGLIGRDADMMLLDDTLKEGEGFSEAALEEAWRWYTGTVYGRLEPGAPIIAVGTRWSKKDIFGRIEEVSKRTGEKWTRIVFRAIAEDDDPLGRKPGEALCEARVPLQELLVSREQLGRQFDAYYQQRPVDEAGTLFDPSGWPLYADIGDAYTLAATSGNRLVVGKQDVTVFITVDWATSEKKTADRTAFGVFGLLPDGRLLVLEMVADRWPLEAVVGELAKVCRRWQPAMVAVEVGAFQTALAVECRRHREIPEVRQLRPEGRGKLQRALAAVVMGENRRILLPEKNFPWVGPYCAEMAAFTGVNDDHDDRVDVTAYAAMQANSLRGPTSRGTGAASPCILTPGKEPFY